MKLINLRAVGAVALLAATITLYQNCSGNFKTSGVDEGASNLSSSAPNHGEAHISPLSSKMEPNTDLEFSVSADSMLPSLTYEWSHSLNGASGACNLKKGSTSSSYVVYCTQAGNLSVSVKITDGGGAAKVLPSYAAVLATAPAAGAEINMLVAFSIPNGTAATPWNSAATMVETFVGQTLKITNMDGQTHQLHTNGKPCGHGSAIASGASTNCVISKAYNSKTDGAVYDHNLGTKSAFFLVAYDGAALYATNCASCHGALASSAKKSARVSQIRGALTNVPAMQSNANLMGLTQRQIEAISYALGAK